MPRPANSNIVSSTGVTGGSSVPGPPGPAGNSFPTQGILWVATDSEASTPDGSSGAPFLTFAAAIDHINTNPGIWTIATAPGEYDEDIVIPAGLTLSFFGCDSETTTIGGTLTSSSDLSFEGIRHDVSDLTFNVSAEASTVVYKSCSFGSNFNTITFDDPDELGTGFISLDRTSANVWTSPTITDGFTDISSIEGAVFGDGLRFLMLALNGQNIVNSSSDSEYGRVDRVDQIANISVGQNIITTPKRGQYMLSVSLRVTTAGTSGNLGVSVTYPRRDGGGTTTFVSSTINITGTGEVNQCVPVAMGVGPNDFFMFTQGVSVAGALKYDVVVTAQRIATIEDD